MGLAVLVVASPPAGAQPRPAPPRPAGSSAVESSDVPPWRPPPARFAVVPFENRSGVRAFDWLVAGAPFEISQKTEAALGLEPTGGALHVGGAAVAPTAAAIATFAATRDAAYVITGWVERPSWQLRISIALWKITGKVTGKVKGGAAVAAEAQRTGELKAYHQLLGEALGEVWAKGAGMAIDDAAAQRLQRALAADLYAVHLMGRGLGHMVGAIGQGVDGVNLRAAEHDLERAVFIEPKCHEAQRLLGELYLSLAASAGADPRLTARAAGKLSYANDLAPDDIASLRAAAGAAARARKHEVALGLLRKLVTLRPWDLEARHELGAALWHTGDPAAAARQLEQVTARQPDHLPARRVLALIHAARSDTPRLIEELEAIAVRAPDDLDVKADLATAYGALSQWSKAIAALDAIAVARPADVALQIRIGDAHRKNRDLDRALAAYARASKLAPDSSWPGFSAAQALFDAGRLAEAGRAYTSLQRHREDLAAAEQALGAIALIQRRADEAAWYLRRAVAGAPRNPIAWRALIAAELARRDATTALKDVAAALPTWPRDAQLRYLAGIAYAMLDERAQARRELAAAAGAQHGELVGRAAGGSREASSRAAATAARAALDALDAGGSVTLQFTPELLRPWGDADALAGVLDHYAATAEAIAQARATYQRQLLVLLGALHRGPYAPGRREQVRRCPVARLAAGWAAAQRELAGIERLGVELEATWRFIARHDEVGATASLMPAARTQVAGARRIYRLALADLAELRAEWVRSLGPELRAAGCSDRLLAAAVADPARYRLIEEDRPETIPVTQPPRPRARATFYVDNSRCIDPVDVWVDGAQVGQVAPGQRSALVADAGERILCLLAPGAAQCGDRGTVRQVYLHDGWSVAMHCPK
jgi:Flp pilus assembly protein TadD